MSGGLLLSVTVTVYVSAAKPVNSFDSCGVPPSRIYMNGRLPPVALTVIVPSSPPGYDEQLDGDTVVVNSNGSLAILIADIDNKLNNTTFFISHLPFVRLDYF